jgi:AraC-like DNA-binding protein
MGEAANAALLGSFTVLDRGAPEEAHELAVGLMNRHRMSLAPSAAAGFHADIRATPLSSVSLLYFSYGASTRISSAPPEFATAMLPLRGRLEHAHGDARHVAIPGGGAFYSEGDPVDARWSADLELLVLRVEPAAIERKLTALSGRPARTPIRFDPVIEDGPAGAALISTVRTLAELHDRFGPGGLPEVIAAEYEELILSMLLLGHAHSFADALRRHAPAPPGRAMRAAVRYIEEHYAQPLTAGDIAEAAHVSERTLFEGFRRELGVTPMTYARRFRLARARDALIAADPDAGATVADISLRHGFGHLGRFAASYRERYGESPSETLRR